MSEENKDFLWFGKFISNHSRFYWNIDIILWQTTRHCHYVRLELETGAKKHSTKIDISQKKFNKLHCQLMFFIKFPGTTSERKHKKDDKLKSEKCSIVSFFFFLFSFSWQTKPKNEKIFDTFWDFQSNFDIIFKTLSWTSWKISFF